MTESRHGLLCLLYLLLAASALQVSGCASSAPVDHRPQLIRNADSTLSKGVEHYNQAEYARAMAAFESALFHYRAVDNPEGIASSCINIAKTQLARGEASAAARWLETAQYIIERNELSRLSSRVTIIRSSIAIENEELDTARLLLDPLLTAAPESLDADTHRAALQNRTRIAFAENSDMATWTERYAAVAASGPSLHQARLARFRAALADDSESIDRYYSNALQQYRQIAHRPGIAVTLYEWGGAMMQRGDYDAAGDRLSRALFIRATMTDISAASKILQRLAEMYKQTGSDQAFNATLVWIGKVHSDGFNDWQSLADSYSVYPVP